jgi:hypothetical protein
VKRNRFRSIIISFVIIILSASNFYKAGGTESIKAVQIVSLLVCGMAIGIFVKSLVEFLREKKRSSSDASEDK